MDKTDPANSTNGANPSLSNPGVLLATWFGSGYLPKAPGTWGSLAALPPAWIISAYLGVSGLLLASLAAFLIGIWASGVYMRLSDSHDPGPVVIDEVAGQWLTLSLFPPDVWVYVIGFMLFRVADILKPWPVSWADQKVSGGLGVMLDDILAGLYAGLGLFALNQWGVI